MVAGTVHRLCQTGLAINEAREKVAKVCREAGIKPGRKGAKDSRGQAPVHSGGQAVVGLVETAGVGV